MDLDGMARYGAAQTKAWELNTHNAVIDDLASDSAANFNNPQRLQTNSAEVDKQTFNYGQTHGWSEDRIKDEMNKNSAKLWSDVIERQALYDPATAAQILDLKTKDGTLPGNTQLELQKKLKPQIEMLQSQSAYGKVTGGATAQAIGTEAQKQGVDPSTMLTIWSAEGGVTNPATKNPRSPATGYFQFMPDTWKNMGGTDQDRLDPNRQIELGVALTKQNTQALTKDLGRQPQPWEVYLAHQQGIEGATALLHADPNANAVGVLGGSADKLTLNGIPADATAGQALRYIKDYVDQHAQMYTPEGNPSAQNIAHTNSLS